MNLLNIKSNLGKLTLPSKEGPDITIYLRSWSVKETREVADLKPGDIPALLTILVKSCCNEAGELLYTDKDIDTLQQVDFKVIQQIFLAACRHNRYLPDDLDNEKKKQLADKLEELIVAFAIHFRMFPDEFESTCSYQNFIRLCAYHSNHPLFGEREDYRSAILCKMWADNSSSVEDFIPFKRPLSPEEQAAQFWSNFH